MSNNKDVGELFFGKWWDIIDKEFPGYFNAPHDQCQGQTQGRNDTGDKSTSAPSQSNGNVPNRKDVASQQGSHLPSRPTRDPRLLARLPSSAYQPIETSDLPEQIELSNLMARGLTLQDAKSYRKNKMDQADMERRMESMLSTTTSRSGRGSAQ